MKPLLAVAGVALLGIAGGVVYIAAPASEEEVVQEVQTARPPTAPVSTATPAPVPTLTPGPTGTVTPEPSPQPSGWQTYQDQELGFSFPHPSGLTVSQQLYDLPEKEGGIRAVQGRLLLFRDLDGVPAISLAIAPNPNDLTIEDWVNTYTGWSGEPQALIIGGELAVLDPKDQLNNPVPQIYFKHGALFFTLQLNINGIPETGYPAALTGRDFQNVVEGFRFAQ